VSSPDLDRLREHLAARDQRMRRLQHHGYACVATLVIVGAWSASRVALGDDGHLWSTLFAGLGAGLGLKWNNRMRAAWLELRGEFEREIERLEAEP